MTSLAGIVAIGGLVLLVVSVFAVLATLAVVLDWAGPVRRRPTAEGRRF
jgi:hypothetical protein